MTYQEVDEETQEIFDSVLSQTSIPQFVTFRVLENLKLKTVCEIKKNSDLQIFLSDVNIAVVVNPVIFDQLEELDKRLIFQECLTGVQVNPDTNLISIEKPDFTTYSGFLNVHGNEKIIRLKECVKSLFDKKEEEEKQAKQQKAEKKSKKKSY